MTLMKKITIENKNNTYKNRHVSNKTKKKVGRPAKPFVNKFKDQDRWFSTDEIIKEFKKK